MRVRLRTLLIILILATTLPVAAFAVWVISRSSTQQAALIDAQNAEQARAVGVAVDQEVESTIAALNVLSLVDPIDATDKAPFIDIAARLLPLHPAWQSLRLIDPVTARILASTAGTAADARVLEPEWIHQIVASGRPVVSNVKKDPGTDQWVVSIGVPVRREGVLKYVLAARIYSHLFSDVLARQRSPAGGVVTLLDRAPRIVARTRNEDRYVGHEPSAEFVARSRDQDEGSWRSVMLEGTPAYSAWSRSPITGWTVGIAIPAEPIDTPVRRSFVALIAAGIAMSAGGLILALFLARGVIHTQTTASAAAAALARGQTLPPFESRIVEAHELAEGLRDAAVILETRLQERDRIQDEADRSKAVMLNREKGARRAAESLSRAKDEFIATLSHELRTPLNAIQGWLALLRTGSLDAKKQEHALEVLERNTRAQTMLIEDLLDMSRAIQGTVRLVMEPLDAGVVVESVVESLRPTAEAKRVTLRHKTPEGVGMVSADPRRVQQMIWNVVSNAVKFTPAGGHVDACLGVEGDDAVIRVRDTGEGIASEFLPFVFDRFRQENTAITRTHSGLGLGLSLVHHLVELHGGTITAESGGKGQGSTFTIRLPLYRDERSTPA